MKTFCDNQVLLFLKIQICTNRAKTPIFRLLMWTILGVSYSKNDPTPKRKCRKHFYKWNKLLLDLKQITCLCASTYLIEPTWGRSCFIWSVKNVRMGLNFARKITHKFSKKQTIHKYFVSDNSKICSCK